MVEMVLEKLAEEEPYFLVENGNGVFDVVSKVTSEGANWRYSAADVSFGGLHAGLDLREIPTHDLTLSIRIPSDDPIFPYLFQAARQLAVLGDYVAFAFQDIGPYHARIVAVDGKTQIYELKPRLFRWINEAATSIREGNEEEEKES